MPGESSISIVYVVAPLFCSPIIKIENWLFLCLGWYIIGCVIMVAVMFLLIPPGLVIDNPAVQCLVQK